MFNRRVFLLTSSGLAVYRGRRTPVRFHVFRDDPQGAREFAAYLDREPRTPALLLIDLVEEEFRTESIPHVFGPDRRALMANRQRRFFRQTPYRYAVFQEREPHGQRNDNVLFAAVTHPDILKRWLGPIAQRGIPLAGICSISILSGKLLPSIRAISPSDGPGHALLIHCNAGGGVRQSFFLRWHLRVSRLAFLPEPAAGASGGITHISRAILEELEKVHRYLMGLRLFPAEHSLDVYFLGNPEILTALERQIADETDTPDLRYHFIDTAKIGQRIGLPGEHIPGKRHGFHADLLFARLLMRAMPTNHYAAPEDTRCFRFLWARMALYAASLALIFASVLWSASGLFHSLALDQRIAVLEKEARAFEDRYAHAKATNLPEMPVDSQSLKAAVETADILRSSKTTPYPMFMALGTAFDGEDALEIQSIEWSAMPNNVAVTGGVPNKTGTRARPRAGPSWKTPPREDAKDPIASRQAATIEGRLVAFRGDYRRAIALVENLAGKLSRIDAVEEVRITRRPLDVSSAGVLTGKASAILGNADFALRVVMRVPGE